MKISSFAFLSSVAVAAASHHDRVRISMDPTGERRNLRAVTTTKQHAATDVDQRFLQAMEGVDVDVAGGGFCELCSGSDPVSYVCFDPSGGYYSSSFGTGDASQFFDYTPSGTIIDVTINVFGGCFGAEGAQVMLNDLPLGLPNPNVIDTCGCDPWCRPFSSYSADPALLATIGGTNKLNFLSGSVSGTQAVCVDYVEFDFQIADNSGGGGDPHCKYLSRLESCHFVSLIYSCGSFHQLFLSTMMILILLFTVKTWTQEHYQYHGQCDLVLVKDEEFASGLGLDGKSGANGTCGTRF